MDSDPKDLQRLYRHRFDEESREKKRRLWGVLVRSCFQKWIPPTAAILDLGCGFGEFLNHVRCARRVGVDVNPDAAKSLEAGIEYHTGDVRNLSMLQDNSIDVVFTSNLMEHLPSKDDVARMIREVRRVLKPGGQFIAVGPNLLLLPGRYWDFWDQVTPITDRSLAELLGILEFKVVERRARFLPYTTRSGLPQFSWLVWLYLKLPPAWLLFGRQFLVRAVKP